ncbi:protein O-mannosyl-transferase 1 [Platysternon megacephalum]|uniref:Protein O-mannosyl-transferase 1 n=1 Tax=Platysternon megacephalum TaxID=55544 RepID=A0A4D9E9A8_9SAUR|nr:protein O-mannosyl-transferase 1 [Platysternon megacephalum]
MAPASLPRALQSLSRPSLALKGFPPGFLLRTAVSCALHHNPANQRELMALSTGQTRTYPPCWAQAVGVSLRQQALPSKCGLNGSVYQGAWRRAASPVPQPAILQEFRGIYRVSAQVMARDTQNYLSLLNQSLGDMKMALIANRCSPCTMQSAQIVSS